MARAHITSGICGFATSVRTRMEGSRCLVHIESDCPSVQELGQELTEVDPFQETSFRGQGRQTLRLGAQHPVPVGTLKAIEVAAGLALPSDAEIKLSRSDE